MFLPDVNLWLALAFDSHVHHATALGWFEASTGASYLCRLTQQAFLRLATNPKVLHEDAVSLEEAWRMYDEILADPPTALEANWRAYTQSVSFTPKVRSDAYLAAFAQAADLELVTLDRDFRRYKQTKCTILQP